LATPTNVGGFSGDDPFGTTDRIFTRVYATPGLARDKKSKKDSTGLPVFNVLLMIRIQIIDVVNG
jgi:hypothetical protein